MENLILLKFFAKNGVIDHKDKELTDLVDRLYAEIEDIVDQFEILKSLPFYGKKINHGDKIFTLKFIRFSTDADKDLMLMFQTEDGYLIEYSLSTYGCLFSLSKQQLENPQAPVKGKAWKPKLGPLEGTVEGE